MDPLTHGVLGAVIGQAAFAARLGRRRAAWWGAFGSMLPDVDTAIVPFFGPLAEWEHHRGLTHALWFAPLAGLALGWLVGRRRPREERGFWAGLFMVTLLSHPLLDLMTSYGTQLLWPFSRHRFAIDAVAIVDPIYTLTLAAALVAGMASADGSRLARGAAAAALALTSAYLAYGWRLNRELEAEARRQLAGEAWVVHAYPTLLQPWLRRVVARGPGEVRVAFASTLDPGPISWSSFTPHEGPAVSAVRTHPTGRMFEWFAMGQTAAQATPGEGRTLVEIDDVRYGFPGEPRHGLWGIRAQVDAAGRVQGPVEPFRRGRPRGLLGWIWRATFPG